MDRMHIHNERDTVGSLCLYISMSLTLSLTHTNIEL